MLIKHMLANHTRQYLGWGRELPKVYGFILHKGKGVKEKRQTSILQPSYWRKHVTWTIATGSRPSHLLRFPLLGETRVSLALWEGSMCCLSLGAGGRLCGQDQPDLRDTTGARGWTPGGALASLVVQGHCLQPAIPITQRNWRNAYFPFFSLGTVVLDTIIPLRQLDFVGMFDSCLQTYIFLSSKLGRRLEEAPPRRERIQKVLKLLLHVLV